VTPGVLKAFSTITTEEIVAYSYDRTAGTRLKLGPAHPEAQASAGLKKMKLKARSQGDLQSATLAAAYVAQRVGKTYFLYQGNSFGHAVWRSDFNPSNYLDPINNTGGYVYSITPELDVTRYDIIRD